jgi:hypothetical protein
MIGYILYFTFLYKLDNCFFGEFGLFLSSA